MLYLYVEAPFAVCRTFTAGWYRPTATFLTPSAAYGLLLNLAGVETRLREDDPAHPGTTPATLMQTGLPAVRLALGAAGPFPTVQTVYQQLHNYPVGSSGEGRAAVTFGNKYNITPVRRELLVGLRAVVAADGNPDLEAAVRRGLAGGGPAGRYGLPFLGDNSFLPDRIEVHDVPPAAHWYEPVAEGAGVRPRTSRLTVWIDRADLSRTTSALYAPTDEASSVIPEPAWTRIDPPKPE